MKSGLELKERRNLEAVANAEDALLLNACSAGFLLEPRTSSPGMALPTMSWAFPLIKKIPFRLAYFQISEDVFSVEVFLLSGN